ncbi:unnamed protein product [Ectocarpus sp. CCAP 1310/34]|nr:unnamed protein product [Ectocarpus sp. CCAP 1310/34]
MIDVEGKRSFTSQNTKDEDGKVLRDPTFIRQRWARWFHKLLNTKSPTIDLHAADKVKRSPTCVPLHDIPSLLEVEEAVQEMANRKAVGPDDLPAELIKLFLDGDQGLFARHRRRLRGNHRGHRAQTETVFRGLCYAHGDNRLPTRMLLGAMAAGVGYRGGQESDWVSRLGEDLVAFNMGDEKEGGKWEESAKDPEVWYNKVEDEAAWFMRKWHRQDAEASAKRQRAREAEAESTAISGPKRKRVGEAAVGGERRPGTAVEASRAAEAALLANHVPG